MDFEVYKMYGCTFGWMYKFMSVQGCATVQVHKCLGVQMYKCTSAYECTGV